MLAFCRIAGGLASSPPFMLGFLGLLKFSAGGGGRSPKWERAGLEGYGLFWTLLTLFIDRWRAASDGGGLMFAPRYDGVGLGPVGDCIDLYESVDSFLGA